jgi:hypothetical protein
MRRSTRRRPPARARPPRRHAMSGSSGIAAWRKSPLLSSVMNENGKYQAVSSALRRKVSQAQRHLLQREFLQRRRFGQRLVVLHEAQAIGAHFGGEVIGQRIVRMRPIEQRQQATLERGEPHGLVPLVAGAGRTPRRQCQAEDAAHRMTAPAATRTPLWRPVPARAGSAWRRGSAVLRASPSRAVRPQRAARPWPRAPRQSALRTTRWRDSAHRAPAPRPCAPAGAA